MACSCDTPWRIPTASSCELITRRQRALEYHPDRWTGKGEAESKVAEAKFKEVTTTHTSTHKHTQTHTHTHEHARLGGLSARFTRKARHTQAQARALGLGAAVRARS